MKELSEFCSNPDKKSKLAFLTSTDGKAEFDAQIHAPMRGILDILDEYGVEISFDHFIEAASFMQVIRLLGLGLWLWLGLNIFLILRFIYFFKQLIYIGFSPF